MVLNIAKRCREIDRQYEFNNNQDLDNGVYHKYANNSDDNEDDEERKQNENDNLSEPMLVSKKKYNIKDGRASVMNSFENDDSLSSM